MSRPPRWATAIIERVVCPSMRGSVRTDLEMLFRRRLETSGHGAARRWYWGQVVRTLAMALRGGTRPRPADGPQEGKPRRTPGVGHMCQDVRFGLRLLAQRPGATAVALVTIALGAGANLTVFSLINGTLLSPPPHIVAPQDLVLLYHSYKGSPMLIPYPRFVAYRERSDVFAGVAAYAQVPLHVRSGEDNLRVTGALVSGDYFHTLGMRAERGRLLGPDDDHTPGADPVAVISDSLWRRGFGGRMEVVGMRLTLNGYPFTVVGVAPSGFRGLEVGDTTDVWLPASMQMQAMASDSNLLAHPLSAWSITFARLREGVDMSTAEEHMTRLASALQEEQESFGGDAVLLFGDVWVSPYLRGDLVEFNRILAVVVGAVMLLACANVANLMLAEALRRRDEIAVRIALGATRFRLLRQLTTEGFLTAVFGSVGGLLLAAGATRLLASFRLGPRLALADTNLSIDGRVMAGAVVLTLVAGVLFAVLPALQASAAATGSTSVARAGASSVGTVRLRGALVVLQVTLSFALLVGAGLLVRTMMEIRRVDLGFRSADVATFVVDFELEGYDEARGKQLTADILRRLRQVADVLSASTTDLAPFTPVSFGRGSGSSFVYLDDGRVPDGLGNKVGPDGRILVGLGSVAPRYFETLGVRLVAGRTIDDSDRRGGRPVIIVSEGLAKTFWPGQNPIGQTLRLRSKDSEPLHVVGVVADIKIGSVTRDEWALLVYQPLEQRYRPNLSFVVRTAGDPHGLLPAIRATVAAADPDLVVFGLEGMRDRVEHSLGQQRFTTDLIVVFGALALAVAAVGLYGVLAHSVDRRRREIGVRMAVGADRADLLALVFRGGGALFALGMLGGAPAAWGLSRVFASTLYGVAAFDPAVWSGAAAVMLVAGVVACGVPAWRATRIDPVRALRSE